MIVFDLKCDEGCHVFEAWFGSNDDFADQKKRGLVDCPICGSRNVRKAPMAPAVGVKTNAKSTAGSQISMAHNEPDPVKMKKLLGKLAKEQAKMLEKSDYVGGDFAQEARAMHDGEQPDRPIHGETTIKEAKSLIEDGLPVSPLPLPFRPPKTDN